MPTLAIDFDGVIHAYSKGWQDGRIYDDPVAGAIEAMAKLQERGYHLIIYTTRAESQTDKAAIYQWLKAQGFKNVDDIKITDRKPPAIAYIDDRAVRFTNWPDMVKLWA